jgi:hypothetical protein
MPLEGLAVIRSRIAKKDIRPLPFVVPAAPARVPSSRTVLKRQGCDCSSPAEVVDLPACGSLATTHCFAQRRARLQQVAKL